MADQLEHPRQLAQLQKLFGPTRVRVGLIGSTSHEHHSPQALANELSLLDAFVAVLNELDMSHVCFLTGANPVFGLTLAGRVKVRRHFAPTFYHLAPTSHPNLLVGLQRTLTQQELWIDGVGATMEARQQLLIESCDMVIAFGGGPGTAREIEICTTLKKPVFPIASTGGAAEAAEAGEAGEAEAAGSTFGPISSFALTPHQAVHVATNLMEIAENVYKVKYKA